MNAAGASGLETAHSGVFFSGGIEGSLPDPRLRANECGIDALVAGRRPSPLVQPDEDPAFAALRALADHDSVIEETRSPATRLKVHARRLLAPT